MPPTPDQLAHGWAFVLANTTTIDRLCARLCTDARLDLADLRQEAAIQCARAHHGYDPSRAAPVTWIWWRVRRARQALLADRNRRDEREVHEPMPESMVLDWFSDRGSAAGVAERRVLIGQVIDRATLEEEAACRTVLADVPGSLLPALIGVSMQGRDLRLARLARAISSE